MPKFENNKETKRKLQIFGKIFLSIGIICVIIAFIEFFSSISSSDSPDLFFLFFIGFPMIFLGSVFLSFGYMKEVNSYVSKEQMPVVKDSLNYLLDGTREETKKTIDALNEEKKICPNCKKENDSDAAFCDGCGERLVIICPYCNKENDSDATFCDSCGKRL